MYQITPPPPTSWRAEPDELASRKRITRQLSGAARTARHDAGGLTRAEIGRLAEADAIGTVPKP